MRQSLSPESWGPQPVGTVGRPVPAAPDGSRCDRPIEGLSGYVHSVETAGTVDGPGVRYVLFLTGCALRCQYCHNPDTWHLKTGHRVRVCDVLADLKRYSGFLKRAGGGLTLTGGEPLAQPAFTRAIFEGAKAMGLHTALDTSGFLGAKADDRLLAATDLVLLDLKSWLPETYRRVTGRDVGPTLVFARRLAALGVPIWLRFVLVPGLTDDDENIEGVADFARRLGPAVNRVELLPFHKMGEAKWQALGCPYTLSDTPAAGPDDIARAKAIFSSRDLTVV